MLEASAVDDVFEYVRSQTNKIDPVLDAKKLKPQAVDQLVESYIADIVLYLMELLGAKRAEMFKRKHLGMRPPEAKTVYLTPGKKLPFSLEGTSSFEGGSNPTSPPMYNTVYGNGTMKNRRNNVHT